MFLIFSSDDCVICYFFHESLLSPFCILHPFLPPLAILVFSSVHCIIDLFSTLCNIGLLFCLLSMDSSINVENFRANTLCFNLAISQICNRLERSLAQKIVSNMLWKQRHCPICHSQCQKCQCLECILNDLHHNHQSRTASAMPMMMP